MAFSEATKDQAFLRACGKCERCGKVCNRTRTNYGYLYPGFEFHHKTSIETGGSDSISNCEFLCEECHIKTKSYGRHR